MPLLTELNERFIALHAAREDAVWAQLMHLASSVEGDLERREIAMRGFSGDVENLRAVRAELARPGLTPEERVGLEGWRRYFEVNTIESEEGRSAFARLTEMEQELGRRRRAMPLGYVDPATGKLVRASSIELGLMLSTNPDELMRRAAWEGLRSIELFALDNGWIDIVRQRNRVARALGYPDYYEYKVQKNEGFGKAQLFEVLDDLEANTREACRRSLEQFAREKALGAIEPWNFDFENAGELTALTDPYFRFDDAVRTWGTAFAAMGVDYQGATMQLDLIDRKGKHENGFMHGPAPSYLENGDHHRARINFTANAVPGGLGSGKRALRTLLHEGGHAAHFANIMMPAPCFGQEYAPTSVAFAETQSMFMDNSLDDPAWLTRYARNAAGESMPESLILTTLEKEQRFRAHSIRRMLTVPYAERMIYETPDAHLTPELVLTVFRETERRLQFQSSAARPLLSIPHLLDHESSAYYHGYVLAELAVHQTRAFFMRRDGHIVDNPAIGRDLAATYWRPGNSKTFMEFIEALTGEPFSAKATVALVNRSHDELLELVRRGIENERTIPRFAGPVNLNATIALVDGDKLIASTPAQPFEEMSATFGEWIRERARARAA